MEFKDRVKAIRLRTGLSQQEFAEKIGCKKSQVGQWEVGNNYPNTENLIAISRTFEESIDWLLTGDRVMNTIIQATKDFGDSRTQEAEEAAVAATEAKAPENFNDKLAAFLERQAGKDELLVKTANAAIDVAQLVAVNLNTLQTTVDRNAQGLQVFQQFSIRRFAALEKVAPEVVEIALDKEMRAFAKTHKMGSSQKGAAGM